ncbi:hypothetical protein BDN72DRAFT_531487 [Pluteus cervinus]|uniref:Uncharacterized protein n=1 Tax=Pluteus cervinus TaxID=181527 RepID=A0ACD3AZX8_9AGAR|nr:hypothetical protein BDN72DRAFT_531487 [Pluteus cervinus]
MHLQIISIWIVEGVVGWEIMWLVIAGVIHLKHGKRHIALIPMQGSRAKSNPLFLAVNNYYGRSNHLRRIWTRPFGLALPALQRRVRSPFCLPFFELGPVFMTNCISSRYSGLALLFQMEHPETLTPLCRGYMISDTGW